MEALLRHFQGRWPVVLVVLDGWGLGNGGEGDAVYQARTGVADKLTAAYARTELWTHGLHVGLPGEGDMGGSEVGHLTLGAGRIVEQGAARIQRLLGQGGFFQGAAAERVLGNCVEGGGALHLVGLLSDGNVHSHFSHFLAFVDEAVRRGVKCLFVHALLDGRDVGFQSALEYVEAMEKKLADASGGRAGWEYAIASGGGRERITMDRDKIWSRVELGWRAHVLGEAEIRVQRASEAIVAARQQQPQIVDQDLPPFVVVRDGRPLGVMEDGDSVVMMNFRSDRALEFSQAMSQPDFDAFPRQRHPRVVFAGMTLYDEDNNIPELTMLPPVKVENPLGDRLRKLGLRQFRVAETQKFPHVTFFFNGGRREALPQETYTLIASDKITSFADAPAMQAPQVAQAACDLIASKQYQFGLINFANPDMVGHTGDLQAVIKAVEATDIALGSILKAVTAAGGSAIVTADHGNADEMITINKTNKQREPSTRHSLNPVPLWIFDPSSHRPYGLKPLQTPNTLANIAATVFVMLAQQPPPDLHPHLFIPISSFPPRPAHIHEAQPDSHHP